MFESFTIAFILAQSAPLLASVTSDSELRLASEGDELKVVTEQFSDHGILFIETKSAPNISWSKSRLTVTFPDSRYKGSGVDLNSKATRSIRLTTRKLATVLQIVTKSKLAIRDHVDIVQSGGGWQIAISDRPFSASYRKNKQKRVRSNASQSSPQSIEQLNRALSDSDFLEKSGPNGRGGASASPELLSENGTVPDGQPLDSTDQEEAATNSNDDSKSRDEGGDNSQLWQEDSSDPSLASTSNLASQPPSMATTSFIAISLMLCILGLAAFVFQRFRKQSLFSNKTREFEIIEKIALGHRQQVVRLRIGKSDLILGVTEHNIQSLGQFSTSSDAIEPKRRNDGTIMSMAPQNEGRVRNSRIDEFKAKLANALSRESSDHHIPFHPNPQHGLGTRPNYDGADSFDFDSDNDDDNLDSQKDPIWTQKNIA